MAMNTGIEDIRKYECMTNVTIEWSNDILDVGGMVIYVYK